MMAKQRPGRKNSVWPDSTDSLKTLTNISKLRSGNKCFTNTFYSGGGRNTSSYQHIFSGGRAEFGVDPPITTTGAAKVKKLRDSENLFRGNKSQIQEVRAHDSDRADVFTCD